MSTSMERYVDVAEVLLRRLSPAVCIVGGAVRDSLLGIPLKDIDFLIVDDNDGDALLAEITEAITPFVKKDSLHLLDRRDQYRTCSYSFVFKDEPEEQRTYDFVFARKEIYASPGAKPSISKGTLREDTFRRDFSINAMQSTSLSVDDSTLTDLVGGREDLDHGRIRILHSKSFIDDPIRVVRAFRFKHRFSFQIESHTCTLMNEAIDSKYILGCTIGRRYYELMKICEEEACVAILLDLHQCSFLADMLGVRCEIRFEQKEVSLQNVSSRLRLLVDAVTPEEREFVIKNLPVSKECRHTLR